MWFFLIIIGIIWVVFANQTKSVSNNGDTSKYKDRVVDKTKSLFERNGDIIEFFENQIKDDEHQVYRSYQNHYIENTVRDCINEICLAEQRFDVKPTSSYLSTWRTRAPKEWIELSKEIEHVFSLRKEKISQLKIDVNQTRNKLLERKKYRLDPFDFRKIIKRDRAESICIDALEGILTPNNPTWSVKERGVLNGATRYYNFPLFATDLDNELVIKLNDEIADFNRLLQQDTDSDENNKIFFGEIFDGYKNKIKEKVIERFDFVVSNIKLPSELPKVWDIDFDPEQNIAIIELKLPDVVHTNLYKKVTLKSGVVRKPLTQKEIREKVPNFHPAIVLRTAYEIFVNDVSGVIKLLVVNGWVEFNDPKTGMRTKTYTASLVVEKSQMDGMILSKLDPVSAFSNLKGKSAGKLIDIIPVSPIMSLDRKDKRFIETKDVLNKLGSQTNLASMDWQDFENLIAELFQKEFSEEGTEIKLTQSSRDKGVDAIVFNPDPIRGGKYVIQAKRYTNTVDVSAVRDLVAVVAHEGASRGILVTTSTFGSDAYAFVQNKPITLLDGAKLLGLLEKHNYKFRIDLAEARKLYPSNLKE